MLVSGEVTTDIDGAMDAYDWVRRSVRSWKDLKIPNRGAWRGLSTSFVAVINLVVGARRTRDGTKSRQWRRVFWDYAVGTYCGRPDRRLWG